MKQDEQPSRICDYEGSNYRTDFWQGKGRDYEDRVERIALKRLLPRQGRRLLEIGAGFGRVTNEYAMYDQVVLLDYSLSHMQEAQEYLGRSPRFTFVAADAYHLPFVDGAFDGATVIRVIHHIADAPQMLAEVRRVLAPGGSFILEFANKRNLKAIVRHALGRQTWNPHDLAPVEFVELNFDFHPRYMADALRQAAFSTQRQLPVSFFRLGVFKRALPTGLLAGADSLLQHSGLLYSPSIFTLNTATGAGADNTGSAELFASPVTGAPLRREGDVLVCTETGTRWAIRDGVYDFKTALDE